MTANSVAVTGNIGPIPSSPLSTSSILDTRAVHLRTEYPSCAIPCIEEFCDTFNDDCLCGPEKKDVDSCVIKVCALPEAIFTRNLTETTCETPVRNRTVKFNVMIISMTACTVAFATTRLVYKQFFSARRRLNTEDWTIIVALALGIPSASLTIYGLTAHGMGKDLWGLQRSDLSAFGRYFYIIQIIYILLMLLVKLTLTFFYLNIFFGRTIRNLLWGTVIFHILTAAAFVITIIFQCLPIAYQWEKFNYINNNQVEGHCVNINAAGWANSAISVTSDIWLLALPLSQIHKLNLHWKKKAGAALMFLTGAIVTVVSFLRLASVRYYASTSNPTWDQWDIVWWSTIEVEVGLICTCLPAIRLILVQLAPSIFGSGSRSASITLNRIVTRSTRNTQVEEEDIPLPKRASAPAASSLEVAPKNPEPVLYSWRNASNTSASLAATDHQETWQDDAPLQVNKNSENWRASTP